ncbi:hypothetical protein [Metabacillus sp. SLBN-84]
MKMLTKKSTVQTQPESKVAPVQKKTFATKAFGAFLLAMSTSVFVQGIPLMFVFIGAYLGVPADAAAGDMDTMVWLLTSVTMMILAVYGFIKWMKFLWRRFITNPAPLFLFKKKETRTP